MYGYVSLVCKVGVCVSEREKKKRGHKFRTEFREHFKITVHPAF